jgi:hypothetical protein
MCCGATAIGQAMSYDTTITPSYVFNAQAKGIVRASCMEDRDAQEYLAPFYIYAQEAKNFTRRHQRW